jgi:hypothetical protein
VAVAEKMHEGTLSEYEDKAPRNHHGPSANPWLSVGDGLATMAVSVPGMERAVQEVGRTYAQQHDDRRTTEGYKDRQKRNVFHLMDACTSKLRLPASVPNLAKQYFYELRARAEKLQKLEECIAACLVIAWQEVARSQ